MIFFVVNPIILVKVLTAKKNKSFVEIKPHIKIYVKLLHPVWGDFLDTVNTIVLSVLLRYMDSDYPFSVNIFY